MLYRAGSERYHSTHYEGGELIWHGWSTGCTNHREAEVVERTWIGDYHRGQLDLTKGSADRPLLRDALTTYLESGMGRLAGATRDKRLGHLGPGKFIDQTLGHVPIAELDGARLLQWWDEHIIGAGRSRSTGGRYLSSLADALRRALLAQGLLDDPVRDLQALLREEPATKADHEENDPADPRDA